jgi:3-phenylpropionate/trans-cinnamate dioxygenase ferredoxin reductase subunit
MSDIHVKYLLAGAGLASSSAAQAIRAIDKQGELMMIGQEINRPYHRPPLSKDYLRRQKKRDEVFTQSAEWFTSNHVQLRTGRQVAHLDAARKSITLDNGEGISFDRLLIATGASPRHLTIPGADLPNVFYLRTLEDAERIHHAIDQVRRLKDPPHVAVIGGGVLGVELAASFRQMGLETDLIVAAAHPWNKFAGEPTGRFLTHYLQDRGITVHLGQRPLRIEGDGRVQRILLDGGGAIRCDFTVAAVGAVANKEILRGTPITAEKAILVDDHCRTNVEGIYAAGDCCAIFDPLFGKHRVLDHWDNAMVTGTLAGTNMAGQDKRYDAVNYFFSDVFDISLSVWGQTRLVERRHMRGNVSAEKPDFIEFGIAADGRIAQVLAVNHPREDELLKAMVARRLSVEGKEEALKDPSNGLASLFG